MKITLTPDIENALNKQAQKKGTTPERLALDTLRERLVCSPEHEIATQEQGTLSEFLSDHIGVISSAEYVRGGADMSEASKSKFTAQLIEKRKQGKL